MYSMSGGIPPLKPAEIKKYQKLIRPEWLIEDNIKLFKEFRFENYKSAIKFLNLVAIWRKNKDTILTYT